MAFSQKDLQFIYQRCARHYDLSSQLLRLVGFRYSAYRAHAVGLLRLKKGDSVVVLGCGTGLSFPLLREKSGPEGRLIGVDPSGEMLDRTRAKTQRFAWNNVDLVQSDVVAYAFPDRINGVLSSGVLGFDRQYDQLIEATRRALDPSGRIAILELKRPER